MNRRRLSGRGTGIVSTLKPDILHCVGNTALLALRNVVPENGARVLVKLEDENPTGSIHDQLYVRIVAGQFKWFTERCFAFNQFGFSIDLVIEYQRFEIGESLF